MNRKDTIVRAVESCLRIRTEKVLPRVLVIDGMSTDGSYEMLVGKYANNEQVKIVRKEKIGFQRPAYWGALQVETEFASYMYDADLISPDFGKIVERVVEEKRDFAMGYGLVYGVAKEYPFHPI